MGISSISNSIHNHAVNDGPYSLKKAIKAYQDIRLTGLTDEEKEEIERLAKEYLKSKLIETEQDRDIFNNYVKSLLKKFGFKGDIDGYASVIAGGLKGKLDTQNEQPAQANITAHFQKSAMGIVAVKNKILPS